MKISFNKVYLVKEYSHAYLVKPSKKGFDKLVGVEKFYCESYRVTDGNHYPLASFRPGNFIAEVSKTMWDEVVSLHEAYHDKMVGVLESVIRENIDSFD